MGCSNTKFDTYVLYNGMVRVDNINLKLSKIKMKTVNEFKYPLFYSSVFSYKINNLVYYIFIDFIGKYTVSKNFSINIIDKKEIHITERVNYDISNYTNEIIKYTDRVYKKVHNINKIKVTLSIFRLSSNNNLMLWSQIYDTEKQYQLNAEQLFLDDIDKLKKENKELEEKYIKSLEKINNGKKIIEEKYNLHPVNHVIKYDECMKELLEKIELV